MVYAAVLTGCLGLEYTVSPVFVVGGIDEEPLPLLYVAEGCCVVNVTLVDSSQ